MDRLKNYFIKQNISYTKLNNIIITGYKVINNKNKYVIITSFNLLKYFYSWKLKYKIKEITEYYLYNNHFICYAYIIDIKYYNSLLKEFKQSTTMGIMRKVSCDNLILVYFYISNNKFLRSSYCTDIKYLIDFNDNLIFKRFM